MKIEESDIVLEEKMPGVAWYCYKVTGQLRQLLGYCRLRVADQKWEVITYKKKKAKDGSVHGVPQRNTVDERDTEYEALKYLCGLVGYSGKFPALRRGVSKSSSGNTTE